MPGPEFERDKAMFELNVAQAALALTKEAYAEQEQRHSWLSRAVDREQKSLGHVKERRVNEEKKLERVLKYHEMMRLIKEGEEKLADLREEIRQQSDEVDRLRLSREDLFHQREEDLRALKEERSEALRGLEDICDAKDVPKLIKEVVRLKTSISRLSLSREAVLRALAHLGSDVSDDRCSVCKRPASEPLTARLICGDCIAEGLIDLHRQAVPWVLDILPEEPKPPEAGKTS